LKPAALNNAMESCINKDNSWIRVYIGILKGQLYISVSNSVSGELKKASKNYISTKTGDGHGFGLLRVDRIVGKYKGYVNRQNEDGVFATEVMLPL
jgi:sensor histidine kinase regulating citrate/malate metabolism